MPRKYVKKEKAYSEKDILSAVSEYKDSGGKLSLRQVAEKYHLDKSLLHKRVLGVAVQKRGRKTALSHQDEIELSSHIRTLAKWGFWEESIPKALIVKGFAATGIYPIDNKRYPLERLDLIKVERFVNEENNTEKDYTFLRDYLKDPEKILERMKQLKKNRAAEERQEKRAQTIPPEGSNIKLRPMSMEEVDNVYKEKVGSSRPEEDNMLTQPGPSSKLTSVESRPGVGLPLSLSSSTSSVGIGPLNTSQPGKSSPTVNVKLSTGASALECSETLSPNSFEALLLKKIGKSAAPNNKRRKIDPHSRVVTSEEYLNMVKDKENLEKLANDKKNSKKTKKTENMLKNIKEEKETDGESKPFIQKRNLKMKMTKMPKQRLVFPSQRIGSDNSETEDDDWQSSGSSLDDINLIEEDPTNVCEVTPCDKVVTGDFVLVNFVGGKRHSTHYKYISIVQDVFPDGDILVMSLKASNDKKTVFHLLEDDISTIKPSQLIGKLPTPEMSATGNRMKYVFPQPVDVYETL